MEKRKLSIFDFDGTLILTPIGSPENKQTWADYYGKPWLYRGWWGREESLDTDVWDMPVVKEVFDDYQKEVKNPDTVMVLLTGRLVKQGDLVKQIVNDSILAVSDTPFHYEVDVEGDKYRDETVQDTTMTWYYSVLPKDYPLPSNIDAEKIANLHFTPEDEIGDTPTSAELQKIDLFYDINLEALKISENLKETDLEELKFYITDANGIQQSITYQQTKNLEIGYDDLVIDFDEISLLERRRKWNPHGKITVEEDALTKLGAQSTVGVMGANVRVRKWGFLVIKQATTDVNGNFQTSDTRTRYVKYSVYFQSHPFFTVKAGTIFWNARYRSTHRYDRSGWFQHFALGGRSHFYSLVQNAAFDYYTRVVPNYGLQRPSSWISISAKYNSNGSSHNIAGWIFIASEVQIRRGTGTNYRGSDGIYASTVHELTHAGHRRLDTGMFSILHQGNKERLLMKESWAEGVETKVTNDRYSTLFSGYLNSNNGWRGYRQFSSVSEMNEYTPMVTDLIDSFNQRTASTLYPLDRVNGYTLNQIQSSLNNCRELDCWEYKLRNDYINNSEQFLDDIFDYAAIVKNNL
jgi:hypothetical protein